MNRIILLVLVGLMSVLAKAQIKGYAFQVNPYAGYELNLLKAPARYTSDMGLQSGINDLWVNAPFVGLKFKGSFFSEDKKHTLEMNNNYRRALFTANKQVLASDFSTHVYYKFNPSNKLKNNLKIGFRNVVKTGDDQDNLLGAPLSYRRFDLGNELKIKPTKKVEITIHPFTTLKLYNRSNFERFLYIDNGMNTALTFRYNLKKKVGFAFYANMHQRNYFIDKEGENEEETDFELLDEEELEIEEETNNRIWRYYTAGFGLKLPVNDKMKLLMRANYTLRQDLIQEKLGYNQYELRVDLLYKYKKWKAGLASAFLHRDYKNFGITTNGERQLLRYNYLKETAYFKYAVSEKLILTAQAAAKMRLSNVNLIDRKTTRSYFIGEVSLGLIWKINSDNKKRLRRFMF